MARPETVYEGEWSTTSLTVTALGLTAQERPEHFRLEAMSELALRLAGGLMLAASTVLWLILPSVSGFDRVVPHGLLAALLAMAGLIVYAVGTRGFLRLLSLDARRGTLSLTRININGQGRVIRTVDLKDIESLFLRRPATRRSHAGLYVRLNGGGAPILALKGARAELELIHEDLCEMVNAATSDARLPKRPTRRSIRRRNSARA